MRTNRGGRAAAMAATLMVWARVATAQPANEPMEPGVTFSAEVTIAQAIVDRSGRPTRELPTSRYRLEQLETGGLRTTMLATRPSPARGALADVYAGLTVDTDPATGALRVRDAQGSALATPRGTNRRAARARRIQLARGTGRASAADGRPGSAVRAAAGLGPHVPALPRPARAGRRGAAGGPGHGGSGRAEPDRARGPGRASRLRVRPDRRRAAGARARPQRIVARRSRRAAGWSRSRRSAPSASREAGNDPPSRSGAARPRAPGAAGHRGRPGRAGRVRPRHLQQLGDLARHLAAAGRRAADHALPRRPAVDGGAREPDRRARQRVCRPAGEHHRHRPQPGRAHLAPVEPHQGPERPPHAGHAAHRRAAHRSRPRPHQLQLAGLQPGRARHGHGVGAGVRLAGGRRTPGLPLQHPVVVVERRRECSRPRWRSPATCPSPRSSCPGRPSSAASTPSATSHARTRRWPSGSG